VARQPSPEPGSIPGRARQGRAAVRLLSYANGMDRTARMRRRLTTTRSVTVTWPLFACGRAAPDTTRTPALRTGGGNRRKGSRQPWGFRRATACVDRSRPDVLTRAQRILCCLDNFIGLDGHCFFDEATPRLLDPYLDGYRKMEHFQTVVS
jgi:hypothetical protein